MSITIETFKNQNPKDYSAEMLVFLPGGIDLRNTVTAINISNIDRDLENLRRSLSELKSITTDILGVSTTITPTSATYIDVLPPEVPYWHYTVENFELTDLQVIDNGFNHDFTGSFTNPTDPDTKIFETQAVFDPSPSTLEFQLSQYEAIENNSIGDRTVGFIYDVDRTTNSIIPSNYQTIISGTAPPAAFQLSNHTSIGISNSRYAGAKTNRDEFGTVPAIGLITFEGKLYGTDISNNIICSQSSDITEYDTFGFVLDDLGSGSYNPIILPETQNLPTAITASLLGANGDLELTVTAGTGITATQTTISNVVNFVNRTSVEQGNVFVVRPTNTGPSPSVEDFIEIESVTSSGGFLTLTVKRGLLGKPKAVIENNINDKLYFYKVKSDTIYNISRNQIFKVGGKKLYLKENSNILLLSNEGRVIKIEKTCSV